MKTILCNISLFTLNQDVYVIDQNNNKELLLTTPIKDLGFNLAMLCNKKSINNIHLYGNENFLDGIIKQINMVSNTKYNNNKLIIEVN